MYAIYDKKKARKRFGSILARKLGWPVATPESAGRTGPQLLVNWGCSEEPAPAHALVWLANTPKSVAAMSHKLKMFRRFRNQGVPCLEWTRDIDTARMWANEGGVYARTVLQGHSGEGIVRCTDANQVPEAPLYTKAVTGKFREYRVHFYGGEIISVQIKRRMSAEKMAQNNIVPPDEDTRSAVRVYKNGWVFCVNNVNLSDESKDICKAAMKAVGSQSGCVDILTQGNSTKVIETNSAPALRSPTVLSAYADAIKKAHLIGNDN